jgi:hypothetical protein
MIGAAIGAAGSLASGVVNAIGNNRQGSKNRKHQLQMQKIQNEWASSESQKSRDFAKSMFDASNDWNSAKNQRSRLEEAGLNPYLMMNGGSAGTAQSTSATASGGSSGSGVSPYQYTPTNMVGDVASFAGAMKSLSDARKSGTEADLLGRYGDSDYSSRIANTEADTYFKQRQSDVATAQKANLLLSAEAQEVMNMYLPQEKQIALSTLGSQYWNMVRDGSIKEEQAKNLLATRLEIEARTAGHRISNKVARSTADSIIDATNTAKMNEAAYNRGYSQFSNDVGFRSGKMDRWAADPVKARWDRGINNAGKFIEGLSNIVGSVTKFGFLRNANKRLKEDKRQFDRGTVDIFDDNKGYSWTRQHRGR